MAAHSVHIFLLGPMGSGKSYCGRELARLLDFDFVDLDERIETGENRTIGRIFAEDGEEAFRLLERDYLLSLFPDPRDLVVATGGGTPCFFDNLSQMNRHGITIYLQTTLELLVERLRPEAAKRPLLGTTRPEQIRIRLEEQLSWRAAYYEQAHIVYEQKRADQPVASELAAYFLRIVGH